MYFHFIINVFIWQKFQRENSLFSDLDSEGFVTDAELVQSHNALKKLDSYIKVLRKSNPVLATQVENLVEEHYKTIRDFRDFNLVTKGE